MAKKWGSKIFFCSLRSHNLSPDFQNRGAAPDNIHAWRLQEANSRSTEVNREAAIMRSRSESERGHCAVDSAGRKSTKDSKSRRGDKQQELELERIRRDYVKYEPYYIRCFFFGD